MVELLLQNVYWPLQILKEKPEADEYPDVFPNIFADF